MRRLIALFAVIGVLAGALAVGDVLVRRAVQSALASHLDQELPGAHATVRISSFPFVGRLAVSGTVPELTADVTGVDAGGVTLDQVRVEVSDLRVAGSQLTHRQVVLESIGSGSVTATLGQAALDQRLGVPLVLGSGTVELGGVQARPTLAVSGGTISIGVPGLPTLQIAVPELSILPCVSAVAVVPGALMFSCRLTSLPPALAGYAAHF